MNESLFERSTGKLGPNVFARIHTTQLLKSFGAAPWFRFDGNARGLATTTEEDNRSGIAHSSSSGQKTDIWAHQAGVNSLAVDRFDGRLLVSGGSDASVKIWDLESCGGAWENHTFNPVASVRRSQSHRFGITHISFYPFDAAAFLTSSYDQTLKVWSTGNASVSASFSFGSKIYTHAISPIASHLLVACGTQTPIVRLADLRSGSNAQGLAGHNGAVLAASWSPRHEHTLATGSIDGTVRIWDIRRAGGAVSMLDQEDSVGIPSDGPLDPTGRMRSRQPAKAHSGPVNGLCWTDDGNYIVSAGQDRRIRVWDAATGANTLANFGPSIKNTQLASVTLSTAPVGLAHPGKEVLFWPNETDILVFDLHDGQLVTRLRSMGSTMSGVRSTSSSVEPTAINRVSGIAWRGAGGVAGSSGIAMGGNNTPGAIYSAHSDGQIRVWIPQSADGTDDGIRENGEAAEERTKKRKAIDDVYKNLMGQQITFT